ncbi:pilus assembly protein [Sphingomonas lutea]|uniref:Pilus assembly protein n=1 Tax=Sphingomonas lutea TaxID=1045317 RepID=A0A7G9SJ90_9SPHN|nr:TadE/TadG family type IV pilus assembly protein [Sphingomonas lutea]QNN67915.1 pilus assembly protein [Sphingomonas lutea]
MRALLRCTRGATSAEFAMVAPLLILLIFGTIDVGRFMWELNQAEKATQMGARMAVVTTPVSPGIVAANYATSTLPAGSTIPASALGTLTCTSGGCTCASNCAEVSNLSVDSTAFNALVARMQMVKPDVAAANVRVSYRGSGFGQAGGATGQMEISPLVTVSLTGLKFVPITSLLFVQLNLPAFSTTLPAEDASGSISN